MAEPIRFPRQNERIELGRPWQPTKVGDILELPPAPQWIWDSRIMRGQVTILGGESKVGKSLLLQQLLSCTALGQPCLGRHTERVRCFGYFCEDTDAWLTTRQFAITDAIGAYMSQYEDWLHWYSPAAAEDCLLVDFEYGKMIETPQWGRLWREIEAQEAKLVTIDTARTVFGGNEMQPRQVTQFMRKLQQKAIEGNLAIVLAAHPPTGNVSRGYAGTGAWLASARAGLSLERPPEYDPITDTPSLPRVLRGIGANYSSGRARAKLLFDPNLKVFVADEPDDAPPRALSAKSQEVLGEELDRVVRLARNNGGDVPADVMHRDSAPARYRKTFDRRTSSNDLYAAQDRLIMARRWVRVRVGGRCLLRPTDGAKYEDEQKWEI